MDNKFILLKLVSNKDKRITLEIGKNSIYKLLDIDGIEGSDYEVNISSNIQYDGGNLVSRNIKPRPISIKFEVNNIGNIENERRKLISFFNSKFPGNLEINYCGIRRNIKYEIEGIKSKLMGVYESCEFIVDLICVDPFLKNINPKREIFIPLIGGLRLKASLPFKLKTISSEITEDKGSYSKNVENHGDVDSPLEIKFYGPAETPCIKNCTINELIKVNKNLKEGELLYVNTEYGNKIVEVWKNIANEKEVVKENAFNYIDLDSSFFELVPGNNNLEYSSANSKSQVQKVEISFVERYLGV